jgi:hypothetical protein
MFILRTDGIIGLHAVFNLCVSTVKVALVESNTEFKIISNIKMGNWVPDGQLLQYA